ncbi:WD40-repeat-containing domain protein, partial [Mycena rosella]
MLNDLEATRSASGSPGLITLVTISPHTSHMASCVDDFSIEISSSATGQILGERLLGHIDKINSAIFSANGSLLVSASSDMTVRLWDVDKVCTRGEPIRGHSGSVMGAASSPCGIKIASVSLDQTVGTDWWSWSLSGLATGHISNGVSLYSRLQELRFSPDGTQAVGIYNDSILTVSDIETRVVARIPTPEDTAQILAVYWVPGGNLIAIDSVATLRVWNTNT